MEAKDEGGLLRIGLFSRLTQISVRMIRHYQDNGLLEPAWVDPFTGYRYFEPEQIQAARLIVGLRTAGFSIEQTAQVLAARDDSSLLSNLLDEQSQRLTAEREEFAKRVKALAQISATLKETPMEFTVRTETMPAMTIAALRRTLATYADEGQLWQEIMPLAVQSETSFPAGGICGATFHDAEYRESDVDVEVWLQASGTFQPVAPMVCAVIPEREVVCVTLTGDYSQMPAVTAAIGAYVAENGLETGPMFNIYRVGPATESDPSLWVTEVCLPIV